MIEENERIPKGWRKLDSYINEHNGQIIIMYDHQPPEDHNCDEMGCGSLDHVMMRLESDYIGGLDKNGTQSGQ